jgi:hypothetical protein
MKPVFVLNLVCGYSLGVVFWEMYSMETPFENLTPVEIVNGLGVRPPLPPQFSPLPLILPTSSSLPYFS